MATGTDFHSGRPVARRPRSLVHGTRRISRSFSAGARPSSWFEADCRRARGRCRVYGGRLCARQRALRRRARIGGPGLCNMVTAVAAAKTDSSPVLILSGEEYYRWTWKGLANSRTRASHADDTSVMKPLTRFSTTVASARTLNHWLRYGVTSMLAQPRGPVHLSLTHDALTGDCAADYTQSPTFSPAQCLSVSRQLRQL